MVKDCLPTTDCGAHYVQEVVAPSGATSCDGPPDGSDQSSSPAKTRDQVIIPRPSWIDGTWDVVTFLTPYYVQQVVSIAFPSEISATTVRPYARWVINSINTQFWWDTQLPQWINPAEHVIYNDQGEIVLVPFPFAVGFHCPRLLRPLFEGLGPEPRILTETREMRRWGRYITITPVANATEFKGRIAAASLQFNSALNPVHAMVEGGPDPGPGPVDPTPPPTLEWARFWCDNYSGTNPYLYTRASLTRTWWSSSWLFEDNLSFDLFNLDGNIIIPGNTPFQTSIVVLTSGGAPPALSFHVTFRVGNNVVFQGDFSPGVAIPLFKGRRAIRSTPIDTDELARYTITPEFSFEALLQADEKSYSNNWIEGAHSRQAWGKGYLEFTPTREWRPLIRAPAGGRVVIDQASIKRDIVDLSGKWHVTYASNIDPKASYTMMYGTHYQLCNETDASFQLFKKPVPARDDGAIEMALTLQTALPHTFPAKFNDGGILPMILSQVKRVGSAGLAGLAKGIVGSLMGGLQTIGTADRVIGYPSMSTTYGNNPVILYGGNGKTNGRRGRKKRANGRDAIASLMSRTSNI